MSYRDREPREMHKAVCADCGQECEVPSTAENALLREDPKDQVSAAGDPLDPIHQTEDTR